MSELLPLEQAYNLRFSLLEYLKTTFNLFEQETTSALDDFLSHPTQGVFRGPYVRLRLPFAPAEPGWEQHLETQPEFTPYGHQAAAFARLSTLTNDRPHPTILTTGTGSGKTEAFLLPILDHVIRANRAGEAGIKALILYPMNALANDQAQRLASLITEHYPGVRAGLFIGEAEEDVTQVTPTHLITNRAAMREHAPDVLLTNYKMLDQLLLRSDDAALWRQSADSLTYLVMDEFHTYDGAQGTDVAMLLRRLGATLKSYWDPTTPHPDANRPLGKLTLVGTSATLGDEADPTSILDFAQTITGEPLQPEAVITETRLSIDQWLNTLTREQDLRPITPNRMVIRDAINAFVDLLTPDPEQGWLSIAADPTRGAQLLCEYLFEQDADSPDLTQAEPHELLNLLGHHPFIIKLLHRTSQATSLTDLSQQFFPDQRDRARLTQGPGAFLLWVLSVLSHLRATCGRAAPSVDVHLWVRELTRVDRLANSDTPTFSWHDDGATDSQPTFPALYCRHCGRSGWGVVLGPTQGNLDHDDEQIRRERLRQNPRFRPLIHVPTHEAHGANTIGLAWFNSTKRQITVQEPTEQDIESGGAIQVLTHLGEEADERSLDDVCPSCGAHDGIRFLGSAVATQLSVALGALFGDEHLTEAEKKALVFTDSVQDAAHRAGFVGSRSHVFTLRSLMRDYIDTDPTTIDRLADELLRNAGADPHARYRLLPPDVAEHERFRPFWQDPSRLPRTLRERVLRRLSFDIALEFGLRTTVGRTLEATTTVAVGVTFTNSELINAARAALERVGIDQLGTPPSDATLVRWVRAITMHMRLRGAIDHPWLTRYRKQEGRRWFLTGGRRRDEGMPAFGGNVSAPVFPYLGRSGFSKSEFEPIASRRGWYAGWTAKCLGHGREEAAAIASALFTELAEREFLGTVETVSGATTFHLSPRHIRVGAANLEDAGEGRLACACTACGSVTRGIPSFISALVDGPCLVHDCSGVLTLLPQFNNYYRRMYMATDPTRIVAREHTSLLPTPLRLEYETQFKQSAADPSAPNVLVATPTLEMGIDIGDLSAVMLSSLPKTVASYLQRMGRAGRLTGNSLTVAFVSARGTQLPLFHNPQRVINGQVTPPATYLDANEILRRQYLAFAADSLARAGVASPESPRQAMRIDHDDTYLRQLVRAAENPDLIETFIACFPHATLEVMDRLRDWAHADQPETSQLAHRCFEAAQAQQHEQDQLRRKLADINRKLPELKQRAQLPAASAEDKEALATIKSAYHQTRRQIAEFDELFWVGALEAAGLLPNYTLIDDSVTLDVSLSWIDPETEEFKDEEFSLNRASAQALREFAPGATFYSQGYAITVDAVDVSRTKEGTHTWSCCPGCGFVHEHHHGPTPATCPRCGNPGIADSAQRINTLPLTHVSSVMRRAQAVIDDRAEDRRQRFYTIATLVDVDPKTSRSWFVENTWFGVRYCPQLTMRWANLGPQSSQSHTYTAAGREFGAGLFHICPQCGQVNPEPGTNKERHHRPWCEIRKEHDDPSTPVALTRTLETEGVVIRLPTDITIGDPTAVPSLKAALMLAVATRLGGAPDHLAIETIKDPTAYGQTNPEALLIYDTVPGGTGYLAEFTSPDTVRGLLSEVAEILRACPCQHDDAAPLACEDCLLPYASPREVPNVSRARAYRGLIRLIRGDSLAGEPGGDDAQDVAWQTTTVEPQPPSRESFLEGLFREKLRERVENLGAHITDSPGVGGTDLRFTTRGERWDVEAQPRLDFTQPDFALRSPNPNIPTIYVYTDGRQFHASVTNAIVADDARKRALIRELPESPQVVAITMGDVEGQQGIAPWFTQPVKQALLEEGGLPSHIVDLIAMNGFEHLITWIDKPQPEAMQILGAHIPLGLIAWLHDNSNSGGAEPGGVELGGVELGGAGSGGIKSPVSGFVDVAQVAAYAARHSAQAALDNLECFPAPADTDYERFAPDRLDQPMVAVYRRGTLAVAIQPLSDDGKHTSVAVVLDDAHLGFDHQESWREWLHLSNLMGWRTDPTIITVTSAVDLPELVAPPTPKPAATPEPAAGPEPAAAPERAQAPFAAHPPVAASDGFSPDGLSPQWQDLLDDALDDERPFLEQLLARYADIPVPQLGEEHGSHNVPVVFSWPGERIAVVAEEQDLTALETDGWQVFLLFDAGAVANVGEALGGE